MLSLADVRARVPALALLLGTLALVGCSGADDEADPGAQSTGGQGGSGGGKAGASGGSGQAGAAGAAAGSGGAGGVVVLGAGGSAGAAGGEAGAAGATCVPGCVAPQTCGQSGVCLDPGACAGDKDCAAGKVCQDKVCVPGSSCGVTELGAEQVAPNFLIVLDRSCSMTDKVGGKTKWAAAVAALTKLTADFKGKIRFGLTMFPDLDKNECAQGKIPLPVAPDNEGPVADMLTKALTKSDPYFPDSPCVTNIDTAMSQAATDPSFKDTTRQSFALLVSDGKQSSSCGGNARDKVTEANIADLAKAGVGTFVVGFGAATDFDQLDKFAQAGGQPNPDPARDYYLAGDEEALAKAFTAIAKQTLGCTYKLQEPPPDQGSIYVFFDQTQQVLQDGTHAKGWDYDPASQTVTFYGETCQALQSGSVASLSIVFGCPGGDTVGVPPGCASGIGCDKEHLCADDPKQGAGYCSNGCCDYVKID